MLYEVKSELKSDMFINMSLDELFYEKKDGNYYVRFYNMEMNDVTVGRCFSAKNDSLMLSLCEKSKLTRRITGGGTVFHGFGITYSLSGPSRGGFSEVEGSYKMIHRIIKDIFGLYDIELEFHTGDKKIFCGNDSCFELPVNYDLMYKGTKIAGGAQTRRGGYFLHQGEVVFVMFKDKKKEADTVKDVISVEFLKRLSGILGEGIREYAIEENEYNAASNIADKKYRNREWILKM